MLGVSPRWLWHNENLGEFSPQWISLQGLYFYNVALKVIKHEPQFSCHDHFSPLLMIFIHWDTKASNKTHAKIFSTNAIWGTTQAEKIWGQQWKHESEQIMMSDDDDDVSQANR